MTALFQIEFTLLKFKSLGVCSWLKRFLHLPPFLEWLHLLRVVLHLQVSDLFQHAASSQSHIQSDLLWEHQMYAVPSSPQCPMLCLQSWKCTRQEQLCWTKLYLTTPCFVWKLYFYQGLKWSRLEVVLVSHLHLHAHNKLLLSVLELCVKLFHTSTRICLPRLKSWTSPQGRSHAYVFTIAHWFDL